MNDAEPFQSVPDACVRRRGSLCRTGLRTPAASGFHSTRWKKHWGRLCEPTHATGSATGLRLITGNTQIDKSRTGLLACACCAANENLRFAMIRTHVWFALRRNIADQRTAIESPEASLRRRTPRLRHGTRGWAILVPVPATIDPVRVLVVQV